MSEQPVFRASFSILNLWDRGAWEQSLKSYFRLEQYVTPAMAEGKELHQQFEKEIQETGCLPAVFGGEKLQNPITEKKIEVQLYDWLTFVGVIDCLDEPTIYEFKTGVTSVGSYANGWQIGAYAILATQGNYYVEKAAILHHNQHTGDTESAYVWLTDQKIEDATNWIVGTAGEIHDYCSTHGLYERFGNREASNYEKH